MLPKAELHVHIEGTLEPELLGGYIDANYAAARTAMNLSGEQLVTLARNSFDACFATQQQRDRWNAELASAAPPQPADSGG